MPQLEIEVVHPVLKVSRPADTHHIVCSTPLYSDNSEGHHNPMCNTFLAVA